jgi:predicted amidohydrolase YtcJ
MGLSLGLAANECAPADVGECDIAVSFGLDAVAGPSPPLAMLRGLRWDGPRALAAATIDAARRCGIGAIAGSLERGKYADFVLLDRDPRGLPASDLAALRCIGTWLNGIEVFRA